MTTTPQEARHAALEVEQHVGADGWDQPARLFALVPTADLVAREPQLADQLSGSPLTPIEQEGVSDDQLEELLARIEWPDAVTGAAVVVERIMLPPEAEDDLPDDPAAAVDAAAAHPARRDVRLVAVATRDGVAHSCVRGRESPASDQSADLLEGPDLVPGLIAQLTRTFEP